MLHKRKEIMTYAIVLIVGLVLWFILGVLYLKIQVAAKHISFPEYDIYRASIGIVLTLIGILIEWKTLQIIFKGERSFRIGLFLFAMILMIFPIIPFATSINTFGLSSLNSITGIISLMYESAYTRSATSILGGILLVRSFKKT